MSKKDVKKMKEQEQKRNTLLTAALAVAALIVVIAIVYVLFFVKAPHFWSLDDQGLLQFTKSGNLDPDVLKLEDGVNGTVERIVYNSQGNHSYALLRIPKNVTKPPVVLVLPGATVNKEADSATAKALAAMGYASFTLDERGNYGEMGGTFAGNVGAGYDAYKKGSDPVQYLQVYDVLRALDYLRTRDDIDSGNIVILGESMGGRFAVISAALDPGVKGVVLVSTSGWGTANTTEADRNVFYNSIEPQSYITKISPRKLVQIQFADDTMIQASSARVLYDTAKDPKAWYLYQGDVHGVYNPVYDTDLHNELKAIFGR